MECTYENNFKRIEKKYFISNSQKIHLLSLIDKHICSSDYSNYTINNIYFDTDNFALIRASLEKPIYKEKLRLRSYGTPRDDDPIYIELKKKFKGVVYKRRISTLAVNSNNLGFAIRNAHENPQIAKELAWFQKMNNTKPKVYIGYDREAYAGIFDPDLRITFDCNLRYRETNLDLRAGDLGELLMTGDCSLMEIKTCESCPIWLSDALSVVGAFPTSFSKYGYYFKTQILTNKYEEVA